MKKDILIAGIAGSGKGTQARAIRNRLGDGVQYFEPGSVLRAFGSNDNIVGNYAKSFTSAGELLPDSFMGGVLGLVFASLLPGNRLLVDGFPRLYTQKEMFSKAMASAGRDFIMFNLDVSEEIARERLLHRLICPQCGATYSKLINESVAVCSLDNETLVHRDDDQSLEAIQKRFDAYYSDIKRVIDEYREEGKVIDIDGTLPEDDIADIIMSHLD